jgi:hypothetical protein
MLSRLLRQTTQRSAFFKTPLRAFGAMDETNPEMFKHTFTNEMKFTSSFDKIKCFRIMDEEGKIVKSGYDTTISDEEHLKMYDAMVTMNEADKVYNAAQR